MMITPGIDVQEKPGPPTCWRCKREVQTLGPTGVCQSCEAEIKQTQKSTQGAATRRMVSEFGAKEEARRGRFGCGCLVFIAAFIILVIVYIATHW